MMPAERVCPLASASNSSRGATPALPRSADASRCNSGGSARSASPTTARCTTASNPRARRSMSSAGYRSRRSTSTPRFGRSASVVSSRSRASSYPAILRSCSVVGSGGHVDVVVPVWRTRLLSLQNATLSAALRLEHVDYNVGTFTTTGRRIFDEVTAIAPALSFRPTAGTVFKRDLLGNPTTRLGGYQVGFATYF